MDRNRITGAGVTSGIDFALTLCGELFGAEGAKKVQLSMEYDPAPPFTYGSPAKAEPDIVAQVRESTLVFQQHRGALAKRIADEMAN